MPLVERLEDMSPEKQEAYALLLDTVADLRTYLDALGEQPSPLEGESRQHPSGLRVISGRLAMQQYREIGEMANIRQTIIKRLRLLLGHYSSVVTCLNTEHLQMLQRCSELTRDKVYDLRITIETFLRDTAGV